MWSSKLYCYRHFNQGGVGASVSIAPPWIWPWIRKTQYFDFLLQTGIAVGETEKERKKAKLSLVKAKVILININSLP